MFIYLLNSLCLRTVCVHRTNGYKSWKTEKMLHECSFDVTSKVYIVRYPDELVTFTYVLTNENLFILQQIEPQNGILTAICTFSFWNTFDTVFVPLSCAPSFVYRMRIHANPLNCIDDPNEQRFYSSKWHRKLSIRWKIIKLHFHSIIYFFFK